MNCREKSCELDPEIGDPKAIILVHIPSTDHTTDRERLEQLHDAYETALPVCGHAVAPGVSRRAADVQLQARPSRGRSRAVTSKKAQRFALSSADDAAQHLHNLLRLNTRARLCRPRCDGILCYRAFLGCKLAVADDSGRCHLWLPTSNAI